MEPGTSILRFIWRCIRTIQHAVSTDMQGAAHFHFGSRFYWHVFLLSGWISKRLHRFPGLPTSLTYS